ncbi:MAG: DUF4153 domain-containing protein [Paludibacter sp.]
MKKFSLKTWIQKIQGVALRFPFTLFFLLGLSFLFLLQINKHGIDIKPAKWVFFSLGITLSLSVTLFAETFNKLIVKIGLNLLSILVLLAYCLFLPDKFEAVQHYQVISIGIVLILSVFVVPFYKKNNDIPFWEFSKTTIVQFIIAVIFSQVLFAGLSLAVLSLKELFKVDVQPKVYEDIAVICYLLFAPIYFLANITAEKEMHQQEFKFDKFVRILGLYIFLPILALYTLILYVYLGQIVIKWQLPNGWVSTLVSVLALGGFVTMLILHPLRLDKEKENDKENVVAYLLSKYFPVIIIPLLVLMSSGILRRLGDYGMTINRLYILILNGWLYAICLYLILSKANHLKWIIISFSTVLFLSSVGPWSVYSITKRSMVKEFGQLLDNTKLLKNGKVIDNSKNTVHIDSLTSTRLYETVQYSSNTYGASCFQSYFIDTIKSNDRWKVLKTIGIQDISGLRNNTSGKKFKEFYASIDDYESAISIDKYKTFIKIRTEKDSVKVFENKDLIVKYKPNEIQLFNPKQKTAESTILLRDKIKQLYKSAKGDENYSVEEMTIEKENYKLIFTYVCGEYYIKNDSLVINSIDAYLFLK